MGPGRGLPVATIAANGLVVPVILVTAVNRSLVSGGLITIVSASTAGRFLSPVNTCTTIFRGFVP